MAVSSEVVPPGRGSCGLLVLSGDGRLLQLPQLPLLLLLAAMLQVLVVLVLVEAVGVEHDQHDVLEDEDGDAHAQPVPEDHADDEVGKVDGHRHQNLKQQGQSLYNDGARKGLS